jgi:hypothetical protein
MGLPPVLKAGSSGTTKTKMIYLSFHHILIFIQTILLRFHFCVFIFEYSSAKSSQMRNELDEKLEASKNLRNKKCNKQQIKLIPTSRVVIIIIMTRQKLSMFLKDRIFV